MAEAALPPAPPPTWLLHLPDSPRKQDLGWGRKTDRWEGADSKRQEETEEQRGRQGRESMKGRAGETGAEGGEVTRKGVGRLRGTEGCRGGERGGLSGTEALKDKAGAWMWGTGTPPGPGAVWQELGTMPLPLCPPPQRLPRLPGNQSSLFCLPSSLFTSLPPLLPSFPPSLPQGRANQLPSQIQSLHLRFSELGMKEGEASAALKPADSQIFIISARMGPRKSTRESSKSISVAP